MQPSAWSPSPMHLGRSQRRRVRGGEKRRRPSHVRSPGAWSCSRAPIVAFPDQPQEHLQLGAGEWLVEAGNCLFSLIKVGQFHTGEQRHGYAALEKLGDICRCYRRA